jgi:hypothetical protein
MKRMLPDQCKADWHCLSFCCICHCCCCC